MKKLFLIFSLLAAFLPGAENDLKLVQEGAGGVPAQRLVPAAGVINSVATFRSQLGIAPLASPTFTGTVTIPTPFTLGAVSVLPTGTELNFVDGVTSAIQTQLNDRVVISTLGANIATFLATPTFANLNAALTGDDAAGLAANNSFSGVNTFAGSTIRTPAAITIAANAGTLTITNGLSEATNGADTTINLSAGGAAGQQLILNAINPDTAAHTWTINNTTGTDPTFTATASLNTPILLQSNGTSFSIVGGAPTINDIGSVTIAATDLMAVWDVSAGITGKGTVASAVSAALTATPATVAQQAPQIAGLVGTYASPDTTAGAVTLTAAVTEIWTNTTTEYDLPAVASNTGKAVIFYVVGTNLITLDPNASEIIVRNGTAQTGGVTMTLAGVAGNYVCLVCDGTRWVTLGFSGTLAAGS